MKTKLIRLAMALYPRAWRRRYSEEFAATLADMPAQSWDTVLDVGKGALVMQIRRNGAGLARTAAKFGVACMVLAFAGSFAIPNRYISNAVVDVGEANRASVALTLQRTFSSQRLQEIVDKYHLYAANRTLARGGDTVETMKRDIHVSPIQKSKGTAFEIGFRYSDPAVAQLVTSDLIVDLIKERLVSKTRGTLRVLDPASKAEDPVFPNRKLIALIGLAGGVLIGFVWKLLMRQNISHHSSI